MCDSCKQNEEDLRWMLDNHTNFAYDRKGAYWRRIVAIRQRLGYYEEVTDGCRTDGAPEGGSRLTE